MAWHEVKTAALFRLEDRAATSSGRRLIVEKFFEASCGDVFEFGRRVFALALGKGLAQAKRLYVVSDGAAWIWNLVKDRFEPATEVLDFYHASEHLWAVGKALHGDDEKGVRKWVEPLLHQLRHGGETRVVKRLQALTRRREKQGLASYETLRREVPYFLNHRDRMGYGALSEEGVPIGSGAVESACRQFQTRFKGPGQFWSPKGKTALLAIDLSRRNHTWDHDFYLNPYPLAV